MEEQKNKPLKPVVFVRGHYNFHRNNDFQQNLLLRALKITSDPKELKKMIGVQRVADVYRTLDKLALRKEYHQALQDLGIDFNTIVGGIKEIALRGEKDSDRLSAWKVFLKSLGLDEYKEESAESRRSWEDVMKEIVDKENSEDEIDKIEGETETEEEIKNYEVNEPTIPEDVQEDIKRENEVGRQLYGE